MMMVHAVELTDVDVYVIRVALEHLFDSWRKESGDAEEYVAHKVIGDLETRLPGLAAGVSVEGIYAAARGEEIRAELTKLEEDDRLTPENAALVFESFNRRDDA